MERSGRRAPAGGAPIADKGVDIDFSTCLLELKSFQDLHRECKSLLQVVRCSKIFELGRWSASVTVSVWGWAERKASTHPY